jgi:streptogrisin C
MKNNAWVSYVKQSETPYDQNLNNLPTMRLKSGNKCLDVNNNVYNDGNKVQIYDCNDTDAQKFIYDNGYLIAAGSLNNNNIQCVARYVDPTVDNYERVILNNCSYDPSQIWNIDGKLIKSPDGKCLDVPNGKYDNGVVPLLYTCNNGSNQMWERI